MNRNLREAILRCLAAAGQPLLERDLVAAVQRALVQRPTDDEVIARIRALEHEKYVTGAHDEFFGQTAWTLTNKGVIQANQLA